MIFLATDRGLWRCRWGPQLSAPPLEAFSVDVPDEAVSCLTGVGERVWAATESGRILGWDPEAHAFLELPSCPDDEAEISTLAMGRDGSLLAGRVPAAVWRLDDDSGWQPVGDMDRVEGRDGWEGLEAPYEPTVTALCDHPRLGLLAAVSVGGLIALTDGSWAPAPLSPPDEGPPRDPRDLAVIDRGSGDLVVAGARGLLQVSGSEGWGDVTRLSLPPSAAFAARLLADGPEERLYVVAAPGPPATWRGPDGARMSVWRFAGDDQVGRPIAGPMHGVATGLALARDGILLANMDGEIWHLPSAGPPPEFPILADLPPIRGIFLVDPTASGA